MHVTAAPSRRRIILSVLIISLVAIVLDSGGPWSAEPVLAGPAGDQGASRP